MIQDTIENKQQFNLEIYNAEKIQTHGGSLRIYVKTQKTKINKNVKYFIQKTC